MDILAAAEAYGLLKEALQDQFDVSVSDTKGKNQGKLILKKKIRHNDGESKNTMVALEMGRRRALAGESLVDDRVRASTEPLRKAFDLLASGQAIAELGKGGLRAGHGIKGNDMKERAWNMLVSYDRGYNPETGAPLGVVGTDGGHKKPHHLYPELSTDPSNIMPENKYENRIKGAADEAELVSERLAGAMIKKAMIGVPNDISYSPAALEEMAAGPEIMRMNRKQYLKAKRLGRI